MQTGLIKYDSMTGAIAECREVDERKDYRDSEFERDLIVERTVAGIQAAKARGVTVGRPCRMSHEQVQHAKTLVEGGEPKRKVARLFKVSTATLYRALAV